MDFPDQLKKPAPTRHPGLDALGDFLWEAACRDADAEQFLLAFHLDRVERDPVQAAQRLLGEGLPADPGMRYRAMRLLASVDAPSADNLRIRGGRPYGPPGRSGSPGPEGPPGLGGPPVGREGERSWALGRLKQRLAGISMICITGPAGVGKTRLAEEIVGACEQTGSGPRLQVRLSRPVAGLELRPSAIKPSDALLELLRQLGVPEADVPAGLDQRKARYADTLTGRRPVILIDGVIDESQVLELLPPAGGTVVVTSRRPLPGLFGGAAWHFALRPLQPAGSRLLIKECFQAMDLVPDDVTIAAITEAAGGMPAPTIVLSRWMAASAKAEIAHNETPEAAVLEALARLRSAFLDRKNALGELPLHEIPAFAAVTAVFDLLSEDQRAVVRALGLLRLPEAEARIVGIAGGLSDDRAQAALQELAGLGLIAKAGTGQSWRLDPHVADYAHADALLSGQLEQPGFREMLGRLTDAYRVRITDLRDLMREPQEGQLRDWCEAAWSRERDCVAAVFHVAVDTGQSALAHELADIFMELDSFTDADESGWQDISHYLDPVLAIARAAGDRELASSALERFAIDADRQGDTTGADALRSAASAVREGHSPRFERAGTRGLDPEGAEGPVRVPVPSDGLATVEETVAQSGVTAPGPVIFGAKAQAR